MKHAAAMVKWDVFRPSQGTGGAAVYDYGSNQKRLLQRKGGGPLRYHLAYKLVDCKQIKPENSTFSGVWDYVVRAGDWAKSRHFRYNDAIDTLQLLEFTSGTPMRENANIGLRLLSIPELSRDDIVRLERLQHKIENGRAVFISYTRSDSKFASVLEDQLSARDISSSRDVGFLHPGQDWKEALQQEAMGCDCFVVLVSQKSAESKWVKNEVRWALAEYEAHGLVKAIVPVVLPSGGWEKFPELQRFERWQYPPDEARKESFDKLANGIVSLSASLK